MIITTIDKRLKILSVLNSRDEISNPLFSICFFPSSEIKMIKAETIIKETIIWSRNGIFGTRNFIAADTGMEETVPQSAASDVVFFQNNPNTKMAVIPGLIIPVYS